MQNRYFGYSFAIVFIALFAMYSYILHGNKKVSFYITGLNSALKFVPTYNGYRHDEIKAESSQLDDSTLTEGQSEFYGKIQEGTQYVVVYNAICKTGSRSITTPLFSLYAKNRKKDTKHETKSGLLPLETHHNLSLLLPFLMNLRDQKPYFVRGHAYFVDLPRDFIYMNVLRDPLRQFISSYYFIRHGDYKVKPQKVQLRHGFDPENLPENWNDSLDECVRKGSYLCEPDSGMIGQFCGFNDRCRVISEWTLEQAKLNLDRYIFVGITEEIVDTIQVMEILLPDITKGLLEEFRRKEIQNRKRFKTGGNVHSSNQTKSVLVRKLALDYQFYHHAKDRFHRLKERLGI